MIYFKSKIIFKAVSISFIVSVDNLPKILITRSLWSIGRVCKQSAIEVLLSPFCSLVSTTIFVTIKAFLSLQAVKGTT